MDLSLQLHLLLLFTQVTEFCNTSIDDVKKGVKQEA